MDNLVNFQIKMLQNEVKDLHDKTAHQLDEELLYSILLSSTDFDDFSLKFEKYMKIKRTMFKNNNTKNAFNNATNYARKMENFYINDLNFNNLQVNNRIMRKKNSRVGKIISTPTNNNNNNEATVLFNNNNNPVKISTLRLKKL